MDDDKISRREFSTKFLGTALSISFLETLLMGCSGGETLSIAKTNKIVDVKASQVLNHWAIELNNICGDLKADKISQTIWQEQIDKLFNRIELSELLRFIDFERLSDQFSFPNRGVNTKNVMFPKLDGLPDRTVFVKKIFGMQKGRAIVPHGHTNMASAHLILSGDLNLKHYDRISEDKTHVIFKPTIDRSLKPGDHSSISDERDNIHWFVATSDSAFSLDVIMLDLGGKEYGIQNLDINESEKIGDGTYRAEKIDVDTALRKYGKDHHQGTMRTLNG
ncbi:MAG: hypothetical protein KDB79_02880 [Acidobacteria bacterium]|nr:hypothetical protein [Acidobacteriota bacterium]